jgi:aminopeptidase N
VLSSVGELPDPAARAVCWNAVINLVRQAELPVAAFTAMLANGVRSEPSPSVLRALHGQAEEILTRLAGPDQAAAGKRVLAETAGQALRSAGSAGSGQRTWIELLSWTATSPDQLDLIAALLNGGTSIPFLTLDRELRWSLLERSDEQSLRLFTEDQLA